MVSRVQIHGLVSKPGFNGRQGRVLSYNKKDRGRYGVLVDGERRPVALKPANVQVLPANLKCRPNSRALAAFVATFSIRASPKAKQLLEREIRAGAQRLGGSWCCTSAQTSCARCAANLCYSGCDEGVADNIPSLLGLSGASAFRGARKLPGELEAALHLTERVSALQKPLGQVTLDNLSEAEQAFLQERVAERPVLAAKCYTNAWGMHVLGICVRGRRLSDIASLPELAKFYRRQELAGASREIEVQRDAPISEFLSDFDIEENGRRGWLTGLLLGYPLWTTVARYHSGGFVVAAAAPAPPAAAAAAAAAADGDATAAAAT